MKYPYFLANECFGSSDNNTSGYSFGTGNSNSGFGFMASHGSVPSTGWFFAAIYYLYYVKYPVISNLKLGDKEQIGDKEPFPNTNLLFYFIRIRNNWC